MRLHLVLSQYPLEMIVRKSAEGLHIIYQAAHGLLAGKIANELKHRFRPPLWLETLVAVIEHDDQQLNFEEKKYLSALGVPLDFTENNATVKQVLVRCERVTRQARSKSLWTAMLVSYHLNFLYGDLRDKHATAKKFLESQDGYRKECRKYFGITSAMAESFYQILRFCDRCSLILSKDEIPTLGRKLEINKSLDGKTYQIFTNEDSTVNIVPWCFEEDEFKLTVEETLVIKPQFKNQIEFRDYLYGKMPVLKEFHFKRE